MKNSLTHKLNMLCERYEELTHLLGQADIIQDQKRFASLSKEYAQLEQIVSCYQAYQHNHLAITQAQDLLQDDDPAMRELAHAEIEENEHLMKDHEHQLQILLLPKDPHDGSDIYLEIRAGTGGDEAAIFVGDLFRMYCRYAEQQKWSLAIMSDSAGEHGGYKEIIAKISGDDVYSKLKFESGAHRVQRIPETESQGRIHTSACTVAILPEVQAIDEIEINPSDLKVDTFRASGAGGQHVNKTDSAIRITHLPTGTVVECQDERSQHKNRARAMSLLSSRLLDQQQQQQQQQQAAKRKSLVGSGDRSERIRTYNFPQNRITDHRVNLTVYKLAAILEGDLQQVIQPLIQEYQAEQLAQMGSDDC